MSKLRQINIQSILNIEKQKLWKGVWNFENINEELATYARITLPSISLNEIDVHAIPLNQNYLTVLFFCFGLFLWIFIVSNLKI